MNATDSHGTTALIEATIWGHLGIVQMMIVSGENTKTFSLPSR